MTKKLPAGHPQTEDYNLILDWHKTPGSIFDVYTNSNGTLMIAISECGRITDRPVTVHAAFIRRYKASNGLGW